MYSPCPLRNLPVQLPDPSVSEFHPNELKQALLQTIATINELIQESGFEGDPSLLNFAVTDGRSIVCTRYTNTTRHEAASLYWSSGSQFSGKGKDYRMYKEGKREDIVIISSGALMFIIKLSELLPQFLAVPGNHFLCKQYG
jgi:glutamine amidotransferase